MLFSMLNVLYIYVSTCRSMCAVPIMADFFRSLISRFRGMLLRYVLNVFAVVLVASIISSSSSYNSWPVMASPTTLKTAELNT